MRGFTAGVRRAGASMGFVPTMGFLHAGHLALIERAGQENDNVVVSIFVNPTQFAPGEDYDEYPRDLEGDLQKAEAAGAAAVFAPPAEVMYPSDCHTSVFVHGLSERLCGLSRGSGHFRGVCTVVTKLLNIVLPHRAYFGQKDMQQALVLGRMVQDLNMPVELMVCPTVREADGLALSSRNTYLSAGDRREAVCLYQALCEGREMIRTGERAGMLVLESMHEELARHAEVEIDYLEVVDLTALDPVEWIESAVLLAGAVRVGGVRLIDNLLVHPEEGPWED